jgi:hypothetical protein
MPPTVGDKGRCITTECWAQLGRRMRMCVCACVSRKERSEPVVAHDTETGGLFCGEVVLGGVAGAPSVYVGICWTMPKQCC